MNGTATPTVPIITSTLPSTLTLSPSDTPLPHSPQPTVSPVEGVVTTQVNVRLEPSTAGEVVGVLPTNSMVQIVGKDPGENWWQILYPPGRNGKAWVTAQYVRPTQDGAIPVVELNELNAANGVFGVILQQVNIRSGPGTNFNSIGILKAQDSVTVTGRDANGTWFQIDFESGPDGKGWVSAAFVKANDAHLLPIVTDAGAIVGTGTPENTSLPPQPTIAPAPIDNDSASTPAINITLSATGTKSFQYTSDVSSPDGDSEDWIQFTTFTQVTLIELQCAGSESYIAELLQNNSVVQNLVCGRIIAVGTSPGAVYAIRFVSSPTGALQYTRFTVRVEAVQ